MRLHLGISRIFESAVLRGARRTLRTAHRITSPLSDATSNPAKPSRVPLERSCLLSPSLPTSCGSEDHFGVSGSTGLSTVTGPAHPRLLPGTRPRTADVYRAVR